MKAKTFAQWQNELRKNRPGISIFTSVGPSGQVEVAWSGGGETWYLNEALSIPKPNLPTPTKQED